MPRRSPGGRPARAHLLGQAQVPVGLAALPAEAWRALRKVMVQHDLDGPVILLDELGLFLAGKDRAGLNADRGFPSVPCSTHEHGALLARVRDAARVGGGRRPRPPHLAPIPRSLPHRPGARPRRTRLGGRTQARASAAILNPSRSKSPNCTRTTGRPALTSTSPPRTSNAVTR